MIESTITRAVQLGLAGARGGTSLVKQVNRATRRVRQGRGRLRRSPPLQFVRVSAPATLTLVAGEASFGTTVSLTAVQTADLIGMYDEYKINWVDVVFMPQADPGNSGVVNNSDLWIVAASDVTNQVTTPTWVQASAFDNHKMGTLQAGRTFTYRFRPKVTNALASGNYAVNQNDWLLLTAAGAAVGHSNVIANIQTKNASSVQKVDYVFRICFSVKQSS